jgi:hypothetical protein
MKDVRSIVDFGNKKTLRLGVLVLSTLLIVGASALVYTRVVYEKALSVGGVGTTTPAVNPAPETLLVLVVQAFVISLSMFGFLRELSKRKNKVRIEASSPAVPGIAAPEGREAGKPMPPLQLPPILREWEEAPKKEDAKN